MRLRESSGRSPKFNNKKMDLWAKRIFDISLSFFGLLLSAPLWLMVAIFIKLEDGGPVFYSQERLGLNGTLFKAWKFRSMVVGAEGAGGPVQSTVNDPRITKIGHILRASAMDELPQIWNIFRGDMSFVGPRAIRPAEREVRSGKENVDAADVSGYKERQSVIPGLTGVAQIYGSHETPRRNKFRYDILYIKKRSFWVDIRLIVLSFWITFRGKWESREKKV